MAISCAMAMCNREPDTWPQESFLSFWLPRAHKGFSRCVFISHTIKWICWALTLYGLALVQTHTRGSNLISIDGIFRLKPLLISPLRAFVVVTAACPIGGSYNIDSHPDVLSAPIHSCIPTRGRMLPGPSATENLICSNRACLGAPKLRHTSKRAW